MLDIQFIRDNRELVKEKSAQKLVDVDIDQLLGFDDERRKLIQSIETLRQERNTNAEQMKKGLSDEAIAKGREIKDQLSDLEHRFEAIDQQFQELLVKVPNIPTEDTPVGGSEEDNQVVKICGEKPTFDFAPKTHDEIFESKGWLDKERAARISGARFAYLKGSLVQMQFALIQFVSDRLSDETLIQQIISSAGLEGLSSKSFTLVLPPLMMKTDAYKSTGRLKAEDVTYKLADDDLWLIGSAEHSLCSMYQNEIIASEDLPIRYLGYSTSFRREAGAYGKDTAGLIRMHHFDKLEMEVFSSPESSRSEHELLIAIQEYLLTELDLHYQVILKCTADIGDPNARGVDINTWFPGQNAYRETHSADYMTDFQARGLKTRYKSNGSTAFVHTNDATALAMGRILAAIAEQNQISNGDIKVPKVLRQYMGGKEII